MQNPLKVFEEDIEDIICIFKGLFFPRKSNPVYVVGEMRRKRIYATYQRMLAETRKSLEETHEPEEVEECMKYIYPSHLLQDAEIANYDFCSPEEYLPHLKKKYERGEIGKLEYVYERSSWKMRFSYSFQLRGFLYFAIPAILLAAFFSV